MMNYSHNSTNDRLNKLTSSYARASQEYTKTYENRSYKVGDTTAHSSAIMNPESEGYNPNNFSHNYDLGMPSGGGVRRYSPLRNSRSRSRERSAEEQLTFRLRP
jgi:hypothetical protein